MEAEEIIKGQWMLILQQRKKRDSGILFPVRSKLRENELEVQSDDEDVHRDDEQKADKTEEEQMMQKCWLIHTILAKKNI